MMNKSVLLFVILSVFGLVSCHQAPQHPKLVLSYMDYAPSEDIDVEIETLIKNTEQEKIFYKDIHKIQKLHLTLAKQKEKDPKNLEEVEKILKATMPERQKVINAFKPLYKKHYSLDELHMMNKLYAAPEIQKIALKDKALFADPAFSKMTADFGKEYVKNIKEYLRATAISSKK